MYGPVTYDLVSLLRDAYIAWDEERQLDLAVRYWERARAAGVPVHADFGRVLARLRMDGRAAPVQGARHLRAPCPSRRQVRLPARHAAWSWATCAAPARATASWRRCCALLEALDGARAGAVELHVLMAHRDDPCRGPRRTNAAAYRCARPSRCWRSGGKPLIVWQIEALARAGYRDVVINVAHLAGALAAALGDGSAFGRTDCLVARTRAARNGRRHRHRDAAAASGSRADRLGRPVDRVRLRDAARTRRRHGRRPASRRACIW